MTLVYLVAAWIVGLLAASWSGVTLGVWLALAVALVIAAIVLRSSGQDRLALACLCFFALGAARFSLSHRPLPEDHVTFHIGRGEIALLGTVDAPPDPRDTHINLRVSTEQIELLDTSKAVSGRVLVQAPRDQPFRYGDRLRITGPLLVPPEYDDFSYRDYLARRGIHALLPAEAVELVERDAGRPWLAAIYALRERSLRVIERLLPSPQAPLLAGILLGDESGIPEDVREAFNRTGAAHVLAISGANFAILLRVLMGLFAPMVGSRRAAGLSIAAIALYAVLVGGNAAVIRAAIMGGASLVAVQTGRRTYGVTSLAFAIWLMTLGSPSVLWDIGFQLSAAATAGLIFFADDLTRLLDRGLRRVFPAKTAARLVGWLTEPLVISVAAQIAVTPLLLVYFGRFSVASLLVNLLIVSIQPYIMIGGWIALVAGLVLAPVGEVLAWAVWLPLTYMLRVVESLARLSWASVDARLPDWLAWLFYVGLLMYGMARLMHRDDRRALGAKVWRSVPATAPAALGAGIALLVAAAAFQQPDGRLHIWFLDAGDGAPVLIQTPRGAQFLVDGGRSATRLQAALGRTLPFTDRRLDGVILTRPDAGAISALVPVFERYSAETILLAAPSDEVRELAGRLAENVRQVELQRGHEIITDDGVHIETLAPRAGEAAALRVSYGEASFLLGDALRAQDGLALLSQHWWPRSTVLHLPGGGSERANTPRFLEAVQPQVVIASVAAGDRSGGPQSVVREWLNLAGQPRLYRTDRDGTVEVSTDGMSLEIRTSR